MPSYMQDSDPSRQTDPAPLTVRMKPITLPALQAMRLENEKIAMLTAYDASFASLVDRSGVDAILIGDSLGMVCQGHASTLPVTVGDIAYHTACVARGNKTAFVLSDLPFGTYGTPEEAFANAVQVIRAGAQMIKIEGGAWLVPTVRFLTERAVPVCGHLGLTPQSVHQMGGFKVQGKSVETAERLLEDALALQAAGATLLVLEGIPAALGKSVTEALTIPTIGIGAGPDCSGQVLVLHDLLGVFPGRPARFVKNFAQGAGSIGEAVQSYVADVKRGAFPAPEHCF